MTAYLMVGLRAHYLWQDFRTDIHPFRTAEMKAASGRDVDWRWNFTFGGDFFRFKLFLFLGNDGYG